MTPSVKTHASASKAAKNRDVASQQSSSGKNGAAFAPPAYGVDFVDRGVPASASVQQTTSGGGAAVFQLAETGSGVSQSTLSSVPAPPVKSSASRVSALQAEAKEDALTIKDILRGNTWLGVGLTLSVRSEKDIMRIAEKWVSKPAETGSRLSAFDYFVAALRLVNYEAGRTAVFDRLFHKMSAERVAQFQAWMQTKGRAFQDEKAVEDVKFEVSKEDVIRGVKVGGELALAVGTGGSSLLARILYWVAKELPGLYSQAKTVIDTVNAIRGTRLDDLKKFISARGMGNLLVKALFGEIQKLPSLANQEKGEQDAEKVPDKAQGEKGLMGLLHIVLRTIDRLKKVAGEVADFINKAVAAMDISRQSWFVPFSMAYSGAVKAIKAISDPGAILNEAAGKLRGVVGNFFNGIRSRIEAISADIKSRVQVFSAPASFLVSLADRAVDWVLNLLITHPPSEAIKQAFAIIQVASGKPIVQLVRDNIPFADAIIKDIAESQTVQSMVEPLKPPVLAIAGTVDGVTNQAGKLIASTESSALGLLGNGAHLMKQLGGVTTEMPAAATPAPASQAAARASKAPDSADAAESAPASSLSEFLQVLKEGLHSRILAIGESHLMDKAREFGKGALSKAAATGKAVAAKVKGMLLGNILPFEVQGKQHHLWAEEREGQVMVLVASKEKTIEEKIKAFELALEGMADAHQKVEANNLLKQLASKNAQFKLVAKGNADKRDQFENEMLAIEKGLEEIMPTTEKASVVPQNYKIRKVSLDPKSPYFLEPSDWSAPQPPVALELPDGTRVWRDTPGGPPRHETTLAVGPGRADYESETSSRSEHGNLPSGPKYERAHTIGQGTGTESPIAIWYAPSLVNQLLQNRGIERYMRTLVANKSDNIVYRLLTKTAPHPRSIRLSHIHYRVDMMVNGKPQGFFEYSINVTGTAEHPTISAAPILFSSAVAGKSFRQQAAIPNIMLKNYAHTV